MPEPKMAAAAAADDENQDHAFLGREFLTWLLWRADRGEATFASDDGDFTLSFGGRARLLGIGADVTDAVLKGRSPAHGVEVRAGLGAGRTLREAELRLVRGDREFRFTVVAETLDLKGVKLPASLDDDGDREDDRLGERLLLLGELEAAIASMYNAFIKERIRPVWDRSIVPALRSWVADGLAVEKEAR
jgi:hypothetical protein